MSKNYRKPILVNKKDTALYMRELGLKTPGRVFTLIDEGATQQEVDDLILKIIDEQNDIFANAVNLNEFGMVYPIYGRAIIQDEAVFDMDMIAKLPYITGIALMPDAHRVKLGHVPVGGVVITKDAILPGVVGNDIACSVNLTTTNHLVNQAWFVQHAATLEYVMRHDTYFGQEMNSVLDTEDGLYRNVMLDRDTPVLHGEPVFEMLQNEESIKLLRGLLGMARNHFGTCGDGNHFIEFGMTQLEPGMKVSGKSQQFAILSHFGSRGVGAAIADFYLNIANDLHKMPKDMTDNAPLFFGDDHGWAEDYLVLMQWAGEFAANSHRYIHQKLMRLLVARGIISSNVLMSDVYTRHNYAWAMPEGIVHRKGATPAYAGQYGVIPATMGHASKIVVGLGNVWYLNSASHGAGRVMSRGTALKMLHGDTHEYVKKEYGITLIGGDRDEDPRAYKAINEVMGYQSESVREVAEFTPIVVRMADPRFNFRKK